MYEKVFEQTERLFKPFSEIWALQAQAAEALARKQSSAMVDVWNQGVIALQSMPSQRNFEDMFKLQQEYWDNLNGCLREMVEDTQGVLLDTNQKITEILQKAAPGAAGALGEAANQMAGSAANAAPKAIETVTSTAGQVVASATEATKKAAPAAKKAASTAAAPAKTTIGNAVKAASSATDAQKSGTETVAAKLGVKADSEKKSVPPPVKTMAAPIAESKSEPTKGTTSNMEDKGGKLI